MKNKKFILNNQKLTQTKQSLNIDNLRRSMCVVSIHQNNYKYRHLISIYKDKLYINKLVNLDKIKGN
ncbi:hypothetical protein D6L39_24330 [Vibrio parahaemolyticus]|nr:hypothetical protein [Vibrio parahaemolyticus]